MEFQEFQRVASLETPFSGLSSNASADLVEKISNFDVSQRADTFENDRMVRIIHALTKVKFVQSYWKELIKDSLQLLMIDQIDGSNNHAARIEFLNALVPVGSSVNETLAIILPEYVDNKDIKDLSKPLIMTPIVQRENVLCWLSAQERIQRGFKSLSFLDFTTFNEDGVLHDKMFIRLRDLGIRKYSTFSWVYYGNDPKSGRFYAPVRITYGNGTLKYQSCLFYDEKAVIIDSKLEQTWPISQHIREYLPQVVAQLYRSPIKEGSTYVVTERRFQSNSTETLWSEIVLFLNTGELPNEKATDTKSKAKELFRELL